MVNRVICLLAMKSHEFVYNFTFDITISYTICTINVWLNLQSELSMSSYAAVFLLFFFVGQ